MKKEAFENMLKEYNTLNSEVKNIASLHLNKIKSYLYDIISLYRYPHEEFDSNVFCKKIGNAINDIYYLSSKHLLLFEYLSEISYLKNDCDLVINIQNILIDIKIILENKEVDYMYN